MTESVLAPVAPSRRHEIVDIVRGFALFGVLVANMVYTAEWFATPEDVRAALPTAMLDELVGLVLLVLIDFKFITLFSMLFGLGLAMQLRRSRDRGQTLAPIFLRRMFFLWIIGIAHAVLIWPGDILQFYAVVGVVLLFISRFSPGVIVAAAFGLGLVCSLIPALGWVLNAGGIEADALTQTVDEVDPKYLAMTEGSYLDIVRMNIGVIVSDYTNVINDIANSAVIWYLGPLWKAMLGFAIGASGLYERSGDLLRVAKRFLPWTLAFGLAGSLIPAVVLIGWEVWLTEGALWARLLWVPVEFAILSLAIAYACGLVILWNSAGAAPLLGRLAPVGRMALTNYLSQSVLFVFILYGIGLGLVGEIGATVCVVISVVIFAAQIALSGWWLKVYRFGPVEWFWRSLTYLKLQPLRRT